MLLFLEWLSKETSRITEEMISKNEPKHAPNEKEKELAILNLDEKKLFVLMEETRVKILQLAVAHSIKHRFSPEKLGKGECERFWEDSFQIFLDSELIKEILWKSIGMRIPNHPKRMGIRSEWKVVAEERSGRR